MITESVETTEYSSDIFKSMDADNSNFVTAKEAANYLKKNTHIVLLMVFNMKWDMRLFQK